MRADILFQFVLWLSLLVPYATSTNITTTATVTFKIATLESFLFGNPNAITGQANWNYTLSEDSQQYINNTVIFKACCLNCQYLNSLRFTSGNFSFTTTYLFSEFNETSHCLNAYCLAPPDISSNDIVNITATYLSLIDDRGVVYARMHPDAVEELTTVVSSPPDITGLPPPPTPIPFTIDQFKTINDTTIGFVYNYTGYFFQVSFTVDLNVTTSYANASMFTVPLDQQARFWIRSYTTDLLGTSFSYSDWLLVLIPQTPDVETFTVLTTDLNYQGIVIEPFIIDDPVCGTLSFHFFRNNNYKTAVTGVLPDTVYHNSYLTGPINSTLFTFQAQATHINNSLLTSRWSANYTNQSNVIVWTTEPSPQVWLEFESESLYDWFNNVTTAFVTNATLEFKTTQDPDEYRIKSHLYSIFNGTDLAVHLPGVVFSNESFSVVFWTYLQANITTPYLLLNTSQFQITINSTNVHLVLSPNVSIPLLNQSHTISNRWYQIGIETLNGVFLDVYIDGQYHRSYPRPPPPPPPPRPLPLGMHYENTINNGPIDNLVIFVNQSIGPLYMAALYEFYGFPYLGSFNVNVSNSPEFVYTTPPVLVCPTGSYLDFITGRCRVCPVGTYQNGTGATNCTYCDQGSYQPSINSTSCLLCPAGTYQPLTTNATTCIPCSAGYFQPLTGSSSCDVCDPGTYQNETASTTCLNCQAGTIQNNTGSTFCVPCPPGYFQLSNNYLACLPCQAGSFSSTSGSIQCSVCSNGKYQPNNNATLCIDCDAGSYQNNTGSTACITCPVGTFQPLVGSQQCNLCAAGSYQNNTGSSNCIDCLPGTFQSSSGQTQCLSCVPGTFQANTTGIQCNNCSAGYYQPNSMSDSCLPCTIGDYQPNTGSVSCLTCPPGSTQLVEASPSCTSCPPGSFAPNGAANATCVECDPGYYQDQVGQASCLPCATGRYTAVSNTSTPCTPCGVGTFTGSLHSTSCSMCAVGTYQSSIGSSECNNCPAGSYQNLTGTTSCVLCPIGTYQDLQQQSSCKPCLAGTFSSSLGATNCTACNAGSYQSNTGMSFCTSCAIGYYTNVTGSTLCTACSIGTYQPSINSSSCISCSAGTFTNSLNSTSCTPCNTGTFTSSTGSSACTNCTTGQYQPNTGSSSCLSCPSGTIQPTTGSTSCVACPAGQYQSGNTCNPCPSGYYQPNNGSSTCIPCAPGTSFSGTGATACTNCSAGFYQPASGSSNCAGCQSGTYSQGGASTCTPCAAGSYTNSLRSTSCSLCGPGSYQNNTQQQGCNACPAGQYQNNSGATDCSYCPIGTFSSSGASTCTVCSAGSYQNNTGSSVCIPCAAGTYQNNTQQTICSACPSGSYSSSTGATNCTSCSSGTYQPNTQQTSCISCSTGTYQSTTQQTTCTACSAGTYQNNTGSTSCISCPTGSFQNTTGNTQCISCSPGTYQSSTQQTTCTTCGAGSYQTGFGASSCTACAQGSASNQPGLTTTCPTCNAGTYAFSTGNTVCTPCSPGSKSNAGAGSCPACPAGTYQNNTGASSCISCSAGTYQQNTQQTTCNACATGSYQSAAGASTCTLCSAGTYANTTGNTQCTNCAINTFSNTTGLTVCYNCAFATQATSPGATTCTNIIPAAPTGLTNSQTTPGTVTWNAVTYANGYNFYYNGALIVLSNVTTRSIPSFDNTIWYNITINAITSQNAVGPASTIWIPPTPSSLSSSVNRDQTSPSWNQYSISWSETPQTGQTIDHYVVFCHTSSNPTVFSTTSTASPIGFSSQPGGTTWYWWIQAVSASGMYSANSTQQSIVFYNAVPTDAYVQMKLQSDMRDTSLTNWQTSYSGFGSGIVLSSYGGKNAIFISCSGNTPTPALSAPGTAMPTSWTVAMWYNLQGGGSSAIVWGSTGNLGSSTTTPNSFVLTFQAMYMVSAVNSYVFTLSIPSTGWLSVVNWVHITVTYDATTATLSVYGNGNLLASGSDSRFIGNWNGGLPFTLGSQSNSLTYRPVCGYVYDLYIYSRALSTTEIISLMNVPISAIFAPAGCAVRMDSSFISFNASVSTTPSTNLNYTNSQYVLIPTTDIATIHDFVCPAGTATTEDTVGYGYVYQCTQDSTTSSYYFNNAYQHCYPPNQGTCYSNHPPKSGATTVNVTCETYPVVTPSVPSPQIQITFEGQITDTSPNTYPLTANNGFALAYDSSRGAVGQMTSSSTHMNLQVGGGAVLGSSYTIMGFVEYGRAFLPNSGKAVIWGNIGSSGMTSTLDNSFYLSTISNYIEAGQYVSGTLLNVDTGGFDYTNGGGTWYHYTVTYDNTTGTLTIFRDGKRYETGSGTTTSQATSAIHKTNFVGGLGIQIGCDTTGFSLVGSVDHFKVWNTVLTDAQIHREWRNAEKPLVPVSLPTLLSVTNVHNTVGAPQVMTWTPPSPQNGDYYNVTYSSFSGASTPVTTAASISTVDTTSTSVTVPGYNPDYWYNINVASASYYGTDGPVTTAIVPSRPTNITTSVTFTSATFNWVAQYTGSISGYYLYATGAVNTVVTLGVVTTYTFSGLANGVTVNVKIQTIGFNNLTFSGNTSVVTATTLVPQPTPALSISFEGGYSDNSTNAMTDADPQNWQPIEYPPIVYDTQMGYVGSYSYNQLNSHYASVFFSYQLTADYSYSTWVWVDPSTFNILNVTAGVNFISSQTGSPPAPYWQTDYGDFFLGIDSQTDWITYPVYYIRAAHCVGTSCSSIVTVSADTNQNFTKFSQWVHYAVTYSSTTGNFSLYENGILLNYVTANSGQINEWISQTVPSNVIGFAAGCYTGTCNTFNGKMDQVNVWSSTLSASQVLVDYQNGLRALSPTIPPASLYVGGTSAGAIGGSPSGTHINSANALVWKDYSGNGYTVTAPNGYQAYVTSNTAGGGTFTGRSGYGIYSSTYTNAYQYNGLILPKSYTISVWVVNQNGNSKLFCNSGAGSGKPETGVANSFYLGYSGGVLTSSNYATDEVKTTGGNAGVGTSWVHVTTSYDATSGVMKMYTNGNLASTSTASANHITAWNSNSNLAVQFGFSTGSCCGLSGSFSEFQLFNTTLTDTQVGLLYRYTKTF